MIIISAKLFINPTMHDKVMGLTQTGFTKAYAQNLSGDFDLDTTLTLSNMILVRNTSFCHDDHICQIYLFFNPTMHVSYGLDRKTLH